VDWPDYFPENCPPQNARRDSFKVYRLVDNDPPCQNDFVPNKLLYPISNTPEKHSIWLVDSLLIKH
jgi:hypothetical protein